jgi:hypothetical protein
VRDPAEPRLRDIAAALHAPVRLDPAFDARVMAVVRAAPRHRRRGLWSRLGEPRTVTIQPLRWAMLAAGIVCIVGAAAALHLHAARAAAARLAAASRQRNVQFVLVAPTARTVSVVGDFNGWDPTHAEFRAKHQGGGVWSVTARVPVGHHRYSFVVDDTMWVADPSAPRVLDDDFGVPNSVLVVGESLP